MRLNQVLASVPPELANDRRVLQAQILHGLTGFAQLGLAVALFVMWRVYHVPFWTAAERCFAVGVTIYLVVGAVAAILLTLARVQPIAVMMKYLSGVVSVGIFAFLHYFQHLTFGKSFLIWAVVWITTRVLVARVERRAGGTFVPPR